MDRLNDDCQLEIIKFLKLTEQLNLFEATKEEASKRWISNIRYVWQHQLKFRVFSTHFYIFAEKPDLLHDFLSHISPTVTGLEISCDTADDLEAWMNYTFPNMRSLDLSVYERDEQRAFDPDFNQSERVMRMIGYIFPGLETFLPSGSFYFKHLAKFKQLRKLDMNSCFPYSDFDDASNKFNGLQNLEELQINYISIDGEDFEIFLFLPKLRKLSISTECNGYNHISCLSRMRGKDVEKLTVNYSYHENLIRTHPIEFDSRLLNLLRKLINLRQLTFVYSKEMTTDKLMELIIDFPLLERLDIVQSQIIRSELDIWQTVSRCPTLKILNIAPVQWDEAFFSSNRQSMKEALNMRSIPLALHINKAGDNERLIRLHFNHPKLNISFETLKVCFIDATKVQFEFYPSEESTNELKTC